MRTRSGIEILEIQKPKRQQKRKKKRFVLNSDIRENGEDTPCQCPMCLSRFLITINPEWYQCPTCHTLFHIQCLLKHIRINVSNPCCPHCKTTAPVKIDDGYLDAERLDLLWSPCIDFN